LPRARAIFSFRSAHLLQARTEVGEAVGQQPAGRQGVLPHCHVARPLRQVLHRPEEAVDVGADARGRVGEQRRHLRQLQRARLRLRRARLRLMRLRGQKVVVHAPHVGDHHAPTDEAAAREVALLRREHRFLAAVAGCVDVGDIVAGRPQRGIGGVQGGSADVENAGGHGCELCGLR